MNYLKILGGAAIGVGAIAAAPFTGGGSIFGAASLAASLAGAGTIAAAAGAGALGAVGGTALSIKEENKVQKKIYEQQAKHEFEKKKFVEKMEIVLKDTTKFYEYIIAMHAIGMATAYADGNVSEDEAKEIDEFVTGILSASLPDYVKKQIEDLKNNPPSLSTAHAFLKEAGITEKGWKDVDDLIEIVISADGNVDQQEINFKKSWDSLRKAA